MAGLVVSSGLMICDDALFFVFRRGESTANARGQIASDPTVAEHAHSLTARGPCDN